MGDSCITDLDDILLRFLRQVGKRSDLILTEAPLVRLAHGKYFIAGILEDTRRELMAVTARLVNALSA